MIDPELEKKILDCLPYSKPFLFVDHIVDISDTGITGTYTFRKTEAFYEGHFTKLPVTPGVLLIETVGQIGLVCLGIFMLKIYESQVPFMPMLSHVESDFLGMVLPGETVTVVSQKEYFRNNLLKCKMKILIGSGDIVQTTMAICTFKLLGQ